METKIVFDLDGTLYNLYGNDYMNAIERIEREEVGMFSKEEMLMVERKSFDNIINKLLGIGVKNSPFQRGCRKMLVMII